MDDPLLQFANNKKEKSFLLSIIDVIVTFFAIYYWQFNKKTASMVSILYHSGNAYCCITFLVFSCTFLLFSCDFCVLCDIKVVPELEILTVIHPSTTKSIIINVQPQYNGHFCWLHEFASPDVEV